MSYVDSMYSTERSMQATPSSVRRRRRPSVANEFRIFKMSHDEVLEELEVTWLEMGLTEDVQAERMHQFYGHLQSLLKEMAGEEKELLVRLKKKRDKALPDIKKLRVELGLQEMEIDIDRIPLVEAENILRKEKESLEAEKARRLQTCEDLRKEDQSLCNELEKETYYVSTRGVPSLEQLAELEKHVTDTRKDRESRLREYKQQHKDLVSWARKMDFVPRTDFETTLFECSAKEFQLSSTNMRLLSSLHEELSQKYEEHLASLRIKIRDLKDELTIWWEKCFATDEQRHALPLFDEENYSDQAYEAYRTEVARWKHYYETRQAVLATVQQWEAYWKEKTDFEYKRDHDPNRFNTRGGQLEKQLKRQHQLERTLLPRAADEVEAAASLWDKENPQDTILLAGLPPIQYLTHLQEEYSERIEREKAEKAKQKQEQLVSETRFGTPRQNTRLKASTPSAALLGRCNSPGSRSIASRVGSPMLRSGTLTPTARSRILAPAASAPRLAAMRSPTRGRPPLPPRQHMLQDAAKPPPIPSKRRHDETLSSNNINIDYHKFKNDLLGANDKLLNSTASSHSVDLNPPKRKC